MRTIIATVLLTASLSFLSAAPIPPGPKKAEPSPPSGLPLIAGETNWGTITQDGHDFVIQGHAQWSAIGYVTEDCKNVVLMWTLLSNKEPCPGYYDVMPDGTLKGVWGRYNGDDGVQVDEKTGKLSGPTMPDEIRKVKREVGEPQ